MTLSPDIANKWLAGQSISEAEYNLNAAVLIIHGPNTGKTGTVCALERLQPEPGYVIETANGERVPVMQSDLAPAA
jgi:hypothetical protein